MNGLVTHFYDLAYNQSLDKAALTTNMCSYFFSNEIKMQEEIRKLLNEKGIEKNSISELLTLMEEASLNMTPLLKIFSKGVLGKCPYI